MSSTGEAAPRNHIDIKVQKTGTKLLVKWEAAQGDSEHYRIEYASLEAAARGVRTRLRELNEALNNDPGDAALRMVAQAGRRLYEEVIPSGTSLRRHLESSQQCDLRILMIDLCQLPWGAIFSGDCQGRADEIRNDFWCIKHNVFAYRPTAADKYIEQASASNQSARIAYVPKELGRPIDSEECFSRAEFNEACDRNRYFTWSLYLRESPEETALLDLNMIRIHGKRLTDPSPDIDSARLTGMLFIDGLDVKTEEQAGMELLHEVCNNWQGMIVSEVPLTHELNFCVDLVDEANATGEKISELLPRLRTAHWPESLLYSVYCVPDFVFETS
jgi:hypothetical protein